jgi:hypothetical protein
MPLLVNALAVPDPLFRLKVPLMVPVAVEAKVNIVLEPVALPMVSVTPAGTLKVVLIVMVFPLAAEFRVVVPFIVKLFNVIVGIAVIAPLVAMIMTSELAGGPPAGAVGVQLVVVVHAPPADRFHV